MKKKIHDEEDDRKREKLYAETINQIEEYCKGDYSFLYISDYSAGCIYKVNLRDFAKFATIEDILRYFGYNPSEIDYMITSNDYNLPLLTQK